MQTKQSVTNLDRHQHSVACVLAAFGLLSTLLAASGTTQAQDILSSSGPVVFQAAGATTDSIQSSVDAFRAALGIPNNLNNPGPLPHGRREINWDGGNPNVMDTTAPVTPFNVFLNTRGSQFTTPGLGLSQAPPSGGLQGGLAVLFGNASYGKTFRTFSPSRLLLLWGATLLMPRSSYRVPMALSRQQSEASARCSQMWTSRQMATQITRPAR